MRFKLAGTLSLHIVPVRMFLPVFMSHSCQCVCMFFPVCCWVCIMTRLLINVKSQSEIYTAKHRYRIHLFFQKSRVCQMDLFTHCQDWCQLALYLKSSFSFVVLTVVQCTTHFSLCCISVAMCGGVYPGWFDLGHPFHFLFARCSSPFHRGRFKDERQQSIKEG